MYKIIGADKAEYGPVPAEQILKWISERRIDAQTLVQKVGDPEWRVLTDYPEFSTPPPIARQNPPESLETLTDRALNQSPLDIGACIGQGWEIVKNNFGTTVGGSFLILLCGAIISNIPFIGGLIGLLLNGALYGGLFWMFIKLARNEEANVGDAFAGFSRSFVHLMLGGIITSLISMFAVFICLLPGLIPIFSSLISNGNSLPLSGYPSPDQVNAFKTALFAGSGILLFVGIFAAVVVGAFLNLIWIFTFPLIVDKQISFWDAMELSRKGALKSFFSILGLLVICFFINLAGLICCCIGVLITFPISYASLTYAYRSIFCTQGTSQDS